MEEIRKLKVSDGPALHVWGSGVLLDVKRDVGSASVLKDGRVVFGDRAHRARLSVSLIPQRGAATRMPDDVARILAMTDAASRAE